MKTLFVWLTIALAAVANAPSAAASETNGTPDLAFAPVEFLVGGMWHGDLPPGPNGVKAAIEAHYEWTENHQGIRFDSSWVIGGMKRPYCSGLYVWNPEKHRIAIVYSDSKGALTEGLVEMAGPVCRYDLKVIGPSGAADLVQARMTHPDPDSYTNEIFTMEDGQWQRLISVRYARRVASN